MDCNEAWRRKVRAKTILIGVVALYLCTFVFIMPNKCKGLGYSSYFVDNGAEEEIWRQNSLRLKQSLDYLKARKNFGDTSRKVRKADARICVSILTTNRYIESGYLTQTIAKFLKEIRNSSYEFDVKVVNAKIPPNIHKEAMKLGELNAMFELISYERGAQEHLQKLDKYEKHRFDLIKALKICDNDKRYGYALLLEDDAFAGHHFAYMLENVVERLPNDNSFGYVKLYHPEKWQGFGYDTKLELVLIAVFSFLGFFGAGIFFLGTKHITLGKIAVALFFTALLTGYVLAFCYTFSRQHLLEFFKFWRFTHFIVNAPGCCTSAVLYPIKVLPQFINFLETETRCSLNYPVDLVPYDYFKSRGLDRLQVVPNLFYHIGYFSSIENSNKNAREFFHLFPIEF